jgi:outer membrane protein assembly factor BamD (BamD/ComL family)
LFAEAVALRRSGNVSEALRAFEQLIVRFPRAPLAENALVERMRLLGGTRQGNAEARRYLRLYPKGFAIAEAQKRVGTP